jgi:hypothetical protein
MSFFGTPEEAPPAEIVASAISATTEKKMKSSSKKNNVPTIKSVDLTRLKTGRPAEPTTNSLFSGTVTPSSPAQRQETVSDRSQEHEPEQSSLVTDESKEPFATETDKQNHAFYCAITGNIVDWSPTLWDIKHLPHKEFKIKWQGTLESFSNADLGHNIVTLSREEMKIVFGTTRSDCHMMTKTLQRIHERRQREGVITPFVIEASSHSDLPFPVSVISQSLIADDGIRKVPDQCNQKIKYDNKKFMPYMCDIHTGIRPSKPVIVTDFRKAFSFPTLKSAFFTNMQEVQEGIRHFTDEDGNDFVHIREGSKIHEMIIKLSENKNQNSSIYETQLAAERVRVEMNRVGLAPLTETSKFHWFKGIHAGDVEKIKSFAMSLTGDIPIMRFLSYRLVPDESVKWNDLRTWPMYNMVQSSAGAMRDEIGIRASSSSSSAPIPNAQTAVIKDTQYNVWLTLKIYYI